LSEKNEFFRVQSADERDQKPDVDGQIPALASLSLADTAFSGVTLGENLQSNFELAFVDLLY